jgi:ABC-type antimicrobial peptide transport system permease subunit
MQAGAIDLSFDLRVLGFATALALVTALICGLAPALQASRPDLVTELKERTTLASGTRWYHARHLMVIGQVRASGEPGAVLGTVRRELQQLEPTMPLLNVNTYRDILANSLWAPRMGASLLSIFGVLALLLAAVGLYGVMAYSVTQRTREIGIRMALGAEGPQVRNMIVRQGLLLAIGGVVLGIAGAFGLARVTATLLFGITGADPLTFAVVPAVLLAVAALSTALPAWKASRVDPIEALRV